MSDSLTTWRTLIGNMMEAYDETFDDVVSSVGDLDTVFDAGFGLPKGSWFMLWTKKRVYFPVEYDGAESVMSVPRYPDGWRCIIYDS